ncbi:replication-associated recombination protein A [Ketobacter alkanivorans]|uniref:Replication-associated recombination protein A n=1 Tax=Ketobacter alkanivorans TaxID=1917421 RepID=A0A2K9LR09_9GAMM|nr:replication-associated recombination protein A [Ketobacter alkanivorans]AUM14776.1 recombination factor protein RarA [Ketobacter alkanivorans]
MRPATLEEYVGQQHLFGPEQPLRRSIEAGHVHSMILWGPPGVGKTTLAMILASYVDAQFLSVSAVLSGVKEIRAAIDQAKDQLRMGRKTILFVDEVHRFNKSQQDAFLPYIEDGTFIFIGATTENPSFELNNALLSRARVYVLKTIDSSDIQSLLQAALNDERRGLGLDGISVDDSVLQKMAAVADGDARRALNLLEICVELAKSESKDQVDESIVGQAIGSELRRFDKGGEAFYDQISALHKAVRGSSPDGALYWFARMLDGGCDPLYIARRVVRMASEDIGNADPRALQIALNAWDVQTRLGSPEGELAIAQAVAYMAAAPKSNAVYGAFNAIRRQIKEQASYEVPLHLRNAPTKLMKQQGYGEEYRYAHDYPDAYAAGENYLPEEIHQDHWYDPAPRGLEIKIGEKLKYLKGLDQASQWRRYKRKS